MVVPIHIGIILDGNRRFARELMKKPWEGHKYGLKKSRDVLQWACEAGIKYVTAYVLSIDNYMSRPKKELKFILSYFKKEMNNMISDPNHVVHQFKINVRFIGRLGMLPFTLHKKMNAVEKMTRGYTHHHLNIAIAYGGQQEIVDAMKSIMRKGLKGIIRESDLNETVLRQHLYTNGQPYPDMIMRTGGEQRLSNFLTFQSVYSELIFTNKKWPEFTKKDFMNGLREYGRRQRRFGK